MLTRFYTYPAMVGASFWTYRTRQQSVSTVWLEARGQWTVHLLHIQFHGVAVAMTLLSVFMVDRPQRDCSARAPLAPEGEASHVVMETIHNTLASWAPRARPSRLSSELVFSSLLSSDAVARTSLERMGSSA